MDANVPADIRELEDQLEAAEREAEALVAGLSEEQGTGRAGAGSWSVAECLDHLCDGQSRVPVGHAGAREPCENSRKTETAASEAWMGGFLRANSDLDLAGVRFPKTFVRGIRFSLATGLHVIVAHERRHLYQAWRVRRAIERADE